MELAVTIVSALLGLSVAFFLSISFYDLLPRDWSTLPRWRRSATLVASGHYALIPRTIRQTPLD